MEKARIDISLVLPDVPDAQDTCVNRLINLLEAKEGIDAAHLLDPSKDKSNQLCIHFDPKQLSLGEVRNLARRVGAELDDRFGHLLLRSQPMHASKARAISERLEEFSGILEAGVSPDGLIRIEFDREVVNDDAIRQAVERQGLRLAEE